MIHPEIDDPPFQRNFDINLSITRLKGLPMRGRKFITAAIGLFAVALAAGCGGGNDGDTASAASPKAEFIKQANLICTKTVTEIQTKGAKLYAEAGPGEEVKYGKKLIREVIVPSFEDQISGLRGLQVPAGDDAQVTTILTALQEVIDSVEADPSAKAFYPYKKAERLSDKYGLTACGRPSLQ